MKKLFIVSMLLIALPGSAMASHDPSAPAQPPQDFVVGGGKHLGFGVGPDVITQAISAHRLPNGKISGRVTSSVTGPGPSTGAVSGHVTCLIVTGNSGIITWIVDKAGAGLEEGTLVVTHVVDGDALGLDPALPDEIRNSFVPFIEQVPPPAGQEGPCFVPVLPPVLVIQGNYTVHDGP